MLYCPLMQVTVKLFGEFREAAGRERVELELPAGATCGEALQRLSQLAPKVGELIFDEAGKLRDHLHVFLNGRNVSTLGGLPFGFPTVTPWPSSPRSAGAEPGGLISYNGLWGKCDERAAAVP